MFVWWAQGAKLSSMHQILTPPNPQNYGTNHVINVV